MQKRVSRKLALAAAGVVAGGMLCPSAADAAAFLWISAPNWSYSAAAAESPIGWVYFWGLSAGAGTYSFAYAFSNDGNGNAAYAFAEASAGGMGGQGGAQVAGFADPYAGISINDDLTDPSLGGSYPSSKPGTNPFSTPYTVDSNGITFDKQSSSQLEGVTKLQAFVYGGASDQSGLESVFGVSGDTGSSAGITDISDLPSAMGLKPLDAVDTDPSNLSSLSFTENTQYLNQDQSNVILIASGEAPEPAGLALIALGGLALVRRRRKA